MATVKVDSNVMREKAAILKANATEISGLITDMMTKINDLKSTWEGTVAENAIRKFTELQEKFEERYTTINDYAAFLENAATEWDSVNDSIVGAMESVGTGGL